MVFEEHLRIYLNDALVLWVLSMSRLSVGGLEDHFLDLNGHLCWNSLLNFSCNRQISLLIPLSIFYVYLYYFLLYFLVTRK